jgi:outer membrane receptor protein involved in Fe transport
MDVAREKDIQEVIVTAQKREESLLDVPAAVSVVSGSQLEALQVNSLSDMAAYVPGLTVFSSGAPGAREVVIRGISTTFNNEDNSPLVGTYVDDLPFGNTAGSRGDVYGLDLNPFDVARIEVLKGPQGTLYGGDTMGGLIKYVLQEPDLVKPTGRVAGDLQYTYNSNEPTGTARAAVSVPLISNVLGIRFSGFYQHNAGYIDNVGTGQTNINHSTETGGKATILWKPFSAFTTKFTAITQDVDAADLSVETVDSITHRPVYGNLKLNTQFPQPFKQRVRDYALHIDWDLGYLTLENSVGYSFGSSVSTWDLSSYGVFCLPTILSCPDYPYGDALALYHVSDDVSKIVDEFRLASSGYHVLQWMLGGFFTREASQQLEDFPTYTPAHMILPARNNLLITDTEAHFKEAAVFGNATINFTDKLSVSGGGRYSWYSKYGCKSGDGLFFPHPTLGCSDLPAVGVATWMADARWHLDKDTMLYTRVATGYRPGGGCPTCGIPALGIPGEVRPDRTTNYELGWKGEYLDRRLQVDLSTFYIKWTDIQLNLLTPNGLNYAGNGGAARSTGAEVTTIYQPTDDLSLNATLAYTDAQLTETVPGNGIEGDRLPGAPLWTGSLTADYTRPVGTDRRVFFGGDYQYRDVFASVIANGKNPLNIPPTHLVGLHGGIVLGDLTLQLFGKNIFNNHSYSGLMYVDVPTRPKYVPVLPRTIGLSAEYRFR